VIAGKADHRRYRPSNGTEGDIFDARFCSACTRDRPFGTCDVLTRTLIHQVSDPDYPTEWIIDDRGPRCTAFTTEPDPPPVQSEVEAEGQLRMFGP
jgi:hypothetical protein